MSENDKPTKGQEMTREQRVMLLRWLKDGVIDASDLRDLQEKEKPTYEEVMYQIARHFHNDYADILTRRVHAVWALLTDYYTVEDLAQRWNKVIDVSFNYKHNSWELTPEVWKLIKPSFDYTPEEPPRSYEDKLRTYYERQNQRVRDLWEKLRKY